MNKPNPLDAMSWKERFEAAFEALCRMEARAEGAESRLRGVVPVKLKFKLHNHPWRKRWPLEKK